MTETELSKKFGLTKAAISYHLHLLTELNLIHIEKVEAEKHGILQKYYHPAAAMFIINPDKIPKEAKAYFIQNQIQFLRGILSAFKINSHTWKVPSKNMEKLASAFLKKLKKVGKKYSNQMVVREDAEMIRVKVYAEALAGLTKQKEWKKISKSQ